MLDAMFVRRQSGALVLCLSASACFNGDGARGLPCQNDDQCGTALECVREDPDDEVGVCGGGTLPTSSSGVAADSGSSGSSGPPPGDATDPTPSTSTTTTGDDSSEGTTGPGPNVCGAPPPATLCDGVEPIADPMFQVTEFSDVGFSGHISVAIGRFVGDDEWEDIAVLNFFQSDVQIFRSNEGQTFELFGTPLLTQLAPYDMVSADFDCDGNDDLAVVDLDNGDVTLAYGAAVAMEPFDTDSPLSTPGGWSMAVGNFDDTYEGLDIIVGCDNSSRVFPNQGGRVFGTASVVENGLVPWSIVTGDIDEDGMTDVVIPNSDQYDWEDANNNDTVTIALSSQGYGEDEYGPSTFTNPIDGGLLEFDGNPGLDLVVASKHVDDNMTASEVNGTISFHANDGKGVLSEVRSPITLARGVNAVATADFNCDGDTDIAIGHDNDEVVWVLWGPDHSLESHTEIPVGSPVATRIEVTDLDHDGYPEMVMPNFGRLNMDGSTVVDGGMTIIRAVEQ